MPTLRFFFDAGSGTVVWAADDTAREIFGGYFVDVAWLPVSLALRTELLRVSYWHDHSLNWDYPPHPGPWREAECRAFNDSVHRAVDRLRQELGPDWRINDEFEDLHEDPDLDRYLADPQGFRR